MSHVSDFTKDSEQVILDLLNETNSLSFTKDEITLVLPVAAPEESPRNTHLFIEAKSGSGYGGSVQVNYDRLPIEDFIGNNDLLFSAESNLNLSDFIAQVNLLLDINLTAGVDYTDAAIGPWEGIPQETKVIDVPMLPGSLVYLGEMTLTITANDVSLSGAITVNDIDGWELPPQEEGQDISLAFSNTQLSDF